MPKSKPPKSSAKPAKAASSKSGKPSPKSSAGAKHRSAKPSPKPAAKAKKPAAKAKAPAVKKPASKAHAREEKSHAAAKRQEPAKANGKAHGGDGHLTGFLKKQQERLLQLRDNILDSMNGVAKDTLRARAEGSEASAFGMHQADAGSDAYDRDFALSLLSQEQDALYEIEEALKRIETGSYGVCEMSGKAIAHARLEAIPFARYTVECQAQIEKQTRVQRSRTPVTSLFGLTEGEEAAEAEEEEPAAGDRDRDREAKE